MALSASFPSPRFFSTGLLVSVAWLFGGCASEVIKVDSLAKPNSEAAISYEIKNRNPLVADDSLRYQEAAGLVRTALSGKGMYEAPAGAKPDMVVDLDYGVGPPVSRREMISEPIYRERAGRVRTETVQTGTDAKGNPVYSTITTYEPSRSELVGYREYEVTVTVYEKYLRLTAHENQEASEGRPQAEIWTVDVTSEGRSRDLRRNLPVLVAASIDYIGKDSQGQKTIRIKDSDSDVAFVKRGM